MTLKSRFNDWDTGEAYLWIANTEPLYRVMQQCETPGQLSGRLAHHIPGIIPDHVDWKSVWHRFEEDRALR